MFFAKKKKNKVTDNPNQTSTTNIKDIPSDIWIKSFKYLSPKYIKNLFGVCKIFDHVLKNSTTRWGQNFNLFCFSTKCENYENPFSVLVPVNLKKERLDFDK